MVNDQISNTLTRIRNASQAKHHIVAVPCTKIVEAIVTILKREGFIDNYEIVASQEDSSAPVSMIIISLKYFGRKQKPAITKLERISKPGARVYRRAKKVPVILGKMGIAIISTSLGVMTDDEARKLKIGGELLCYIW